MKKIFLKSLTALALINILGLQGQTVVFKQHKVNRGETVTNIAKQHNVFVKDIYKYNPDAENGIKENTFLLIPNIIENDMQDGPSLDKHYTSKETVSVANTSSNTHLVQKNETLYSISKKYNISIEDILQLNPSLKIDRLQTGQYIVISKPPKTTTLTTATKVKTETKKQDPKNVNTAVKSIIVQPKETIYRLALDNNTTIQMLYSLNPTLEKEGLKAGDTIYVPISKQPKEKLEVIDIKQPILDTYKTIVVQAKETLYSLKRQYNTTLEQLIKLNPELIDGLKTGMKLRVPNLGDLSDINIFRSKTNTPYSSNFTDLEKTIDRYSFPKELVLLLPFNAHKIDLNPTSIQDKLKKDAFLNMTLDFYSGALIAIDSAKSLGLPLNVKIFDSKESKTSSGISSLVFGDNFKNTNVIIGPFFHKNVEKTAELIKNSNIALVSPLSTERGYKNSNQIQAMPNSSDLKTYLIEYMLSQNGNIIAIVDDKKTSTKKFLAKEYPYITVLNGSGVSNISNYLSNFKKNFVILDTGSIQTALNTTNTLIEKIDQYNIQLASFEKNEIFDSSEISLDDIVKLKLLYPSVIRDNENKDGNHFAKLYKQKNNVYPNRYATRGFDVTMDVILRMFQQGDFKDNIANFKTQQVENKFIYSTFEGVIYNQGIYLLYYNDDLTVKIIE